MNLQKFNIRSVGKIFQVVYEIEKVGDIWYLGVFMFGYMVRIVIRSNRIPI